MTLSKKYCFLSFLLIISTVLSVNAQHKDLPVYYQNGKLFYTPDEVGNRVPDYSYCGYQGGDTEIPNVPVVAYVKYQDGNTTELIQEAIDYVATLPLNKNGFRGAILLGEGNFRVNGRFNLTESGIIIRGSGADKTYLAAAGKSRETLFSINGKPNELISTPVEITDKYVPVNSLTFNVPENHPLKSGDHILIQCTFSKAWIDSLGMFEFGGEETNYLGWKEGRNIISWDRTITKTNENTITIDAPITTAINQEFGGGTVKKYNNKNRIQNIGLENLSLVSEYEQQNPKDEDHCWFAITMNHAENCWVRQVNFKHFAGSAVAVYEGAKKITIEDCISTEPVSEIGGQRRYTFFTTGQQVLFQRCYAMYGYHDFSVGYMAAGPNAFVQCESYLPYSFSGTIDRWASGVLFDLVNIDGNKLSLRNRELEAQGAGWTAANSMIWQCSAAKIECYAPPTANCWAYGAWAQFQGNGFWHEGNSHIKPRSLYYAQLTERLGKDTEQRAQFLPNPFGSTSSPTIEQAAELTAQAINSPVQLIDWINDASDRTPISTEIDDAKIFDAIPLKLPQKRPTKNVSIKNGWLCIDNAVLTGKTIGIQWWRGNTRPDFVSKSTPHLTRFVPGRVGNGLTDNINEVAGFMEKNNIAAIDHHYGLWYERRRDDHERIRRMNGEVWPPFYELPFARSGYGTAWDGLSKYDLSKPNYFYWSRLQQFASQADLKGLILMNSHYFQHNILEAGAHYADFPWRTANNINNTPFPEPPPYAGDKRIFLAEQFYDVFSNNQYKALHKQYIEQCLNAFENNTNVLQLISAEFTGPLQFTEFWIDVIAGWEETHQKNVYTCLSVTKDVQDAILNNKKRASSVDIIDIRYWQIRNDSTLYAPEGGKNLAPRQFARLEKTGKPSFESVYMAVSKYRMQFPDKAVIYSNRLDKNQQWAVLMGGGSLAAIPTIQAEGFLESLASMQPVKQNNEHIFTLKNNDNEQIIYLKEIESLDIELIKDIGKYQTSWIDPTSGMVIKTELLRTDQPNTLNNPLNGDAVLWIHKL